LVVEAYWRVEGPASGEDVITVHTYELATGEIRYEPAGSSQDTLSTTLDRYRVTVDLTALS
jgi:hypothetical protein